MGESENKSLIFTETKRRADELTRRMRRDGYSYSLFAANVSFVFI